MPLNKHETKTLLLNLFRLTLALADKRSEDAIEVVGDIMDKFVLLGTVESSDLSTISVHGDEIDLVVKEIQEPPCADCVQEQPAYIFNVNKNEVGHTGTGNACVVSTSEEMKNSNQDSKSPMAANNPQALAQTEYESDSDVVEDADAEKETDADAEDEELELNLEPVMIKKNLYWKDVDSGDLYEYLPEDEVGEKIGSYVNGKPKFWSSIKT